MCSQTPNKAQERATHTNRRNGGGNATLTIAPVGTSKHQSGHVEEFPTPHAPICAHLQGDLLMQEKVWLRAEQKKGGDVCQRQSTPHLHHSMRSATKVARRALVASISTPLWRGQEHAVRDLSRRGCPAGNQTSTHHLASTKRRKQPCGSVGQVAGNPRMTC